MDENGQITKPTFHAVYQMSPVARDLWDWLIRCVSERDAAAQCGEPPDRITITYGDLALALAWRSGSQVRSYTQKQLREALSVLGKGHNGHAAPFVERRSTYQGLELILCRCPYCSGSSADGKAGAPLAVRKRAQVDAGSRPPRPKKIGENPYGILGDPKYGIQVDVKKKEWLGITAEMEHEWQKTYLALEIEVELRKIMDWIVTHPDKTKANYHKFIVGWLRRNQERGGDRARKHFDTAASPELAFAELRRKIQGDETPDGEIVDPGANTEELLELEI